MIGIDGFGPDDGLHIGPARTLGTLPKLQRRISIALLLLAAAATIFAAAEPFAEGLVHSGVQLGIDEFLLVQWLAPLASEAPEFLFAGILNQPNAIFNFGIITGDFITSTVSSARRRWRV